MNTKISANTDTGIDFAAIKTKQQASWASGDYCVVGSTLQIVGEQLCESMDLRSGKSVLDVAAGNGNATLAAARRFCNVTSTDYVESLLERSKARADANGFDIDYRFADVESLPFDDGSFDNIVSTFGVMFAPNQEQAAAEMIRTCRQGGRIGMANWTPDGFIGQLFKTIGKHVPPPAGVQSPSRWGTKEFIDANFGKDCSRTDITITNFNFRYESPEAFMDIFKTYYGPVHKACLAAADPVALEREIIDLTDRFNLATDGTMVVPSEYAEVVITR